MFLCIYLVCFCILISLSCQEVEAVQGGKHIEGRCVNSSCSTLPLLRRRFASQRECVHLETLFFWAKRNISHSGKLCDFDFSVIQRDSDYEEGSGYLSVCVCVCVCVCLGASEEKWSFLIQDPF